MKYIVCELFIEISITAACEKKICMCMIESIIIVTVQLVVLRHDKMDETIEGIFFGRLLKRKISKNVYNETKPLGYCILKA